MAASQAGRRTLSALWKQGWNEYPEIMVSAVLACAGVGLSAWAVYKYEYLQNSYYRRYKMDYIVFRDDDPRVKLIRTD